MSNIVADLLDFYTDTIVATPGYLGDFGEHIPSGTVLSLPCRIEGSVRLVRDINGQEVVSTIQVFVAGFNDLNPQFYRYTLPSRWSPSQSLRAIAVRKESDDDGPCYEEIDFP